MCGSAHIRKRLADLLEGKRIIVWTDGERAFNEMVKGLAAPGWRVEDVGESALRAGREAEAIACRLNDGRHSAQEVGDAGAK
jgi:hypothetical protein